ncbi:HAMP domain-containing histidine kinase [Noviherbaspirillum sp. L7-7A]|uniref:sensor histidine kinase n=1 Tax=Noviherbaspirillum sp. L7-7A TaxID=2850560 RepID=UPI001C2C1F46|nr:HAMP domain-containing sensor histidine kinase [Noviherbaspirillum sp. L7-7A]MBV0881817.1 HAMP domain-containing histidine kinase [Noviherbaspirillum sp. L7-7A]
MKPDYTLKHRIARAFILLAIVLAGFYLLASYVAVEVIESQVIGGRMDRIADTLIGRQLRHERVEPPPDMRFYVNEDIPKELLGKPRGLHELTINKQPVQALIKVVGGDHFAVVQELDEFEHTEFIIYSALSIGFISSILLAVVLGYGTARRMVTPLTTLAEAVGNGQPAPLSSLAATDEIGVLARALTRRTDELQRFLERERLFTGDVSHELRTPLTIMLGAAELLEVQLDDRPKQQEIARRLQRVARDTAERVSALLWLSRAPEKLAMPAITLGPLIRQEIERYQPLLGGKPVACRFEEQAHVRVKARPELVAIAIGNLVRNACQHTERGEVLVQLQPGSIVISDTGPGLPEQVVARLFERFVHGGAESSHGSGMGLSIVKRVADHLGWKIRFERSVQGGSRFVLTLPPPAQNG